MRDFNITGKLDGKPRGGTVTVDTKQQYPIGTIYETHGCRFRYCQAYEAVPGSHRGITNMSLGGGDTGGGVFALEGAIGFKGYKGNNFVEMDNVANGDPDTIFPVDWFYGGQVNFYIPSAAYTDLLSMRISGSELATTAGVKLWLDEPLPIDIAATVFSEAHPSPYLNVGATQSDQFSVVAVNYIILSAGDYFWGQTRGPCYVMQNTGTNNDSRMKVWSTPSGNGSMIEQGGVNDIRQHVGYALVPNVTDGMVMLMLE
jgi:hypothetical protein